MEYIPRTVLLSPPPIVEALAEVVEVFNIPPPMKEYSVVILLSLPPTIVEFNPVISLVNPPPSIA